MQRYLTDALIARTRELETRLAAYEGQSPSSASPEQSGKRHCIYKSLSFPCLTCTLQGAHLTLMIS